uniref:FLYWCH-type domain-containing protein n=1 Tax=Anopheles epiroticus TaxID=199890 RepID=A0A182PMY4_9DIPT
MCSGFVKYLNKPITLVRSWLNLVQGQRENKLLMIGGYTYARNNISGTRTIYWACRASHERVRCNSRVVTTLMADGKYRITITNPRHNHPRRDNRIKDVVYKVKLVSLRQRGGSNTKKTDQTKWLKMDLSPILQRPSEPVVLVPCRLGVTKIAADNKRKGDYRNNPDEFELPDPVKPGVSVIRSYRPVQKVSNTDGKQRKRANPVPKPSSTNTTGPSRLRKLSINEILATPGTPVIYLTNRFGSAKVVLDEHQYVYHFAANGVSYYRCEQFKRNQCPAQILVVGGMTHAVNVAHTHPVDKQSQEQICSRYTVA